MAATVRPGHHHSIARLTTDTTHRRTTLSWRPSHGMPVGQATVSTQTATQSKIISMPGSLWLLGHRGSRATKSIPENTFRSFDLALQHGCDGFEFDVRRTGDGRAVICHDPKISSITVANANANQLRHLPLLEDVLQRYSGRAWLDIELKVSGLEADLLRILSQHIPTKGYAVSSFQAEVILEIKRHNTKIKAGIIFDQPLELKNCLDLPVDYVVPHHSLVTQELVHEVRNANKRILTWTVNDRDSMLRLAAWGVDGIISDDTKLLAQTFGKKV